MGMTNIDSFTHTRGESVYLDDLPILQGTLFGACFDSPVAHGHLKSIDYSLALQMPGVHAVLTHQDITGINQIGGIVPDEPLLADQELHFCGMPVALVLADTEEHARLAVKKINIEYDVLPPVLCPREAQQKGMLIVPPRTFRLGDSANAFANCQYVIEGTCETNGQEHLYIETQGAYAIPAENGSIKIYSSTQGPTAVQRAICKVTGLAMHQVEVDVTRLGGGFGGKEDQANTWAALCALATHITKRPVKYALNRMEDMRMTGKRHPYSSDFKLGLSHNLKLIAYEITTYQNAGAAADLSPAVLERTLFHCTNTYYIPHITATAYSCKTNLPPNTAFRGFGGPQGMFIIESAIAKAAEQIGVPAWQIQQQNLINTGQEFAYGQKVESEAGACWQMADKKFGIADTAKEVQAFNQGNQWKKMGMSVMPICFGISFTNTLMNQARALVHVYTDGSVMVSTGAVEMGQGVNTKIMQVAAHVFGLPPGNIKIGSTNTYRIANTSPSAASATADLNGKATLIACEAIAERLKQHAAALLKTQPNAITFVNQQACINGEAAQLNWSALVLSAYQSRISLSEHGHYATPAIHYDKTKEKGHPFAYHVFGTAITTTTIDCIRGTYEINSIKLVHDFGNSMNKLIDRGQIEGGVVQGIGWMTMEEVVYDQNGKLRSNALSTYKVPDIYSIPHEIVIEHLPAETDNLALFKSKAVGEPPLMYGIGTYFALRNAVTAFNPGAKPAFDAPMTPEKLLMNLYSNATVQQPA
jgi:xanthine dehydrogenase large subunit